MCRLLIVDSNTGRCERTKQLLDWSAYGISSVMTANSYLEAVDKAIDLKPQVALVDLHLGEHMGYELAQNLRAIGMNIIFCMTADELCSSLILSSMRAGAQEYLTHPLDGNAVRAFLERTVASPLPGRHTSTSQEGLDPVLGVSYDSFSTVTRKIIMVIRSDYRSPQTLSAIAQELNMSSKYIGRVFLKDTGIKFSEYLMSYRMLEARRLIVSTREKISVIAGMVGYVQLNNFYTHFRNYFGVSPSALRNFEALPLPGDAKVASGGNYAISVQP